jgi:nicotinamidase-related amidase
MPIPRLKIDQTALLVIDMQEKLVPTIIDRERLVTNCAILLRFVGEIGIPYLLTEHYPNGLGRTVDELTSVMIDPASRIEKTRFSAFVDLVDERLLAWRRTSVLVCGIEANVCVAQTVLDLQASGRQAFVVSDAIAASQVDQVAPAVRRMESAGAITTGVMAAMYELLGDAAHPARRACVELAKQIRV